MPVDAKYFDKSATAEPPQPGRTLMLVHFELPPQYCGVLEYFSQYTDLYGRSCEFIETPGLFWTLRVNQRPLFPYIDLEHIVNPWGYGSFQVALRLDESAALDLVVRAGPATSGSEINKIGARIVGRYWYNAAFGDVSR